MEVRELTTGEREVRNNGWLEYLATAHPNTNPDFDSFESGVTTGLDHNAAANKELTFAFNLAGETCKKLEAERDALKSERAGLWVEVEFTIAERDALREALFKHTKVIKRMVKDWRTIAAGDYCQTYNRGMGQGLEGAAGNLEDYVNDAWRALNPQGEQK